MKRILQNTLLFYGIWSGAVGAQAQSSERFFLTRSVVADGGATFSTSSRFQLANTIAQPLAAAPSSARFSIQGGFWIFPPQVVLRGTKTNGNFVVSFDSEVGQVYLPQYLDSFVTKNWLLLNQTNVVGDGTFLSVTNFAPNSPQRFYRIQSQ